LSATIVIDSGAVAVSAGDSESVTCAVNVPAVLGVPATIPPLPSVKPPEDTSRR
jgi:hypothetical protein